jgi:hypothetical protein
MTTAFVLSGGSSLAAVQVGMTEVVGVWACLPLLNRKD